MPIFHVNPSGDPVTGWLVPGGDYYEVRYTNLGDAFMEVANISCPRWHSMTAAEKRAAIIDYLSHKVVGTFGEENISAIMEQTDRCTGSGVPSIPNPTPAEVPVAYSPFVTPRPSDNPSFNILRSSAPDHTQKTIAPGVAGQKFGSNPATTFKPSGAISFGAGDAYGVGTGNFGAPTRVGYNRFMSPDAPNRIVLEKSPPRDYGTPICQQPGPGETTEAVPNALCPRVVSRGENLLRRLGMTCNAWQAGSWNPAAQENQIQLSFQVGAAEAASIRDAIHAYCGDLFRTGQIGLPDTYKPAPSPKTMAPSGAITASSAAPWIGGAAIGAAITYFACRSKKR